MTDRPDRAAMFARVKDDGRADACLIAHWAALTLPARSVDYLEPVSDTGSEVAQ